MEEEITMAPNRAKRSPNTKAGPLFGAGLIGGGIGFMMFQSTGNFWLSTLVAITITVFDYYAIVAINNWRDKRSGQ